jgi:hypothetical protein
MKKALLGCSLSVKFIKFWLFSEDFVDQSILVQRLLLSCLTGSQFLCLTFSLSLDDISRQLFVVRRVFYYVLLLNHSFNCFYPQRDLMLLKFHSFAELMLFLQQLIVPTHGLKERYYTIISVFLYVKFNTYWRPSLSSLHIPYASTMLAKTQLFFRCVIFKHNVNPF